MNYTEQLKNYGDPYEKEAVDSLEMSKKFPRYAEFWYKFVVPKRDPNDPRILLPEVSTSWQKIYNTHYSIMWNFLRAKKQNLSLEKGTDLFDISVPLAHLALCVDLAKRVFVLVGVEANEMNFDELSVSQLEQKLDEMKKLYSARYKEFTISYRPVQFTIHSIHDLFKSCLPKSNEQKKFLRTAENITEYRNIMLHSVSPIRIPDEITGFELIVRPERLHEYKEALWNDEIDPNDFEKPHIVIDRFLDELLTATNSIWDSLIQKTAKISDSDKQDVRSGSVEISQNSSPPQYPSGYKPIDVNSLFR